MRVAAVLNAVHVAVFMKSQATVETLYEEKEFSADLRSRYSAISEKSVYQKCVDVYVCMSVPVLCAQGVHVAVCASTQGSQVCQGGRVSGEERGGLDKCILAVCHVILCVHASIVQVPIVCAC